MKIDIAKWEQLCKQMSLDLEKCRSKEIISGINGLTNIKSQILLHFILWPLVFIIVISIIGIFLIWPQSWLGGILWILTGLLVGPFSGFSVAAYWVVSGLEESAKKIYMASLDTVKNISSEIKNKAEKIPDNMELPTSKELLILTILSLVMPVLKELMIKKLWPFGRWISNIVSNFLKKMSQNSEDLIVEKEDNLKSVGVLQIQNYCEVIIKNTEAIRNKIGKIQQKTSKLIIFPFRLNMRLYLSLNAILLLLIWYFFL